MTISGRVFPQLFSGQLVGVPPMTGPTRLAYALRHMYGHMYEDTSVFRYVYDCLLIGSHAQRNLDDSITTSCSSDTE